MPRSLYSAPPDDSMPFYKPLPVASFVNPRKHWVPGTTRTSLKNLAAGSNCLTSVVASQDKNPTGLSAKQHETYQVIVPDNNQVWYDGKNQHTPPCGSEGSFTMNLAADKKQAKESLWFSVIAELVTDGARYPYDLCKSDTVEVSHDGSLVLYANDAVGYYYNNYGNVWLEIKRLK